MEIDTTRWSGDGELTQRLIDRLRDDPRVARLRVEDAPASREDVGYTFISNELFVTPHTAWTREPARRWGFWPATRRVGSFVLTLADIEALLLADADIGAPDFSDEGMLQFLRTERIIPPYQTRGYKLVELIRIYITREALSG